ncbi:DMT family transporter [Glaciecola petra]|uniref:EamA family transporter n=1 Tax=Glaciecola petra TaxID=3075602 RepID=A0ABU2ZRN0_9ALTE|nr:EamA family transporter [Aestuariibacter sp. P117]MDT0595287.1 EamA family transporter [Aestuariibacter sp. P117]
MRIIDFIELLVLGAIWGSSFILMKWAVPEFGVFALVEVRAIGATLLLLPIVYVRKQHKDMFSYWQQLFIVGLLNTAVPFCLFNYAIEHVEAGLAAILNATAPMFGIIIAYLYLKETIGKWGLVGVLLGFFGVILISVEQTSVPSSNSTILNNNSVLADIVPILALLLATLCYGIAAVYLKSKLGHIKPFAIAAGSQLYSSLMLLPFALFTLPSSMPSMSAIASALFLAFVCTGLAYVLYFDLIAKIGASRAITVGYLVPLFAIIWAYMILDETLSTQVLIGGACILFGVMMATNMLAIIKAKRKSVATSDV